MDYFIVQNDKGNPQSTSRKKQGTIFYCYELNLLPGDDMDLHGHGKLLLVLLQFEQADITDSQTIATNIFEPASAQKPPATPLKRHHFDLPYLSQAAEPHGLPSSWKM
jgi:hypothetical protein